MSQLNLFKVRKWGALLLVGNVTTIAYAFGTKSKGMLVGIGAMLVGLLVSIIIANILLRDDFRAMLEGQGVLFQDITSTGIIRPFILAVRSPFVEGKDPQGRQKKDIFDREMVYHLAKPQKGGFMRKEVTKDGKTFVAIVIDEETYNRGRMALYHYPTVIYNGQLGTILTKDMLSEMEKTTFAEHQILHLNRQAESLNTYVMHFARHVVDQLKPKSDWYKSGWVIILLVIFLIIMAALFFPQLGPAIQNAMSSGGAVGT